MVCTFVLDFYFTCIILSYVQQNVPTQPRFATPMVVLEDGALLFLRNCVHFIHSDIGCHGFCSEISKGMCYIYEHQYSAKKKKPRNITESIHTWLCLVHVYIICLTFNLAHLHCGSYLIDTGFSVVDKQLQVISLHMHVCMFTHVMCFKVQQLSFAITGSQLSCHILCGFWVATDMTGYFFIIPQSEALRADETCSRCAPLLTSLSEFILSSIANSIHLNA